ncbi:shikimate dehydrogenase [Haliovirga abyssi]|uniref:Shikimate dehydrogenase (NADP(+)) n=1 Tax=Haliovirga abyssi TaxID=2996794 RepID=A0AAU9D0S5_9FUSO|nr:shikimate dehydrogenase [Haliovirga abyssi]BDU49564.1 shikimate dehydrogenase [Haliovirga abyssi]
MRIDSKTKLISLLGYPVGHSKSPLMHNAELETLGVNAIYTAMEIEPQKLGAVVNGLKSINNFIGANVTIPHKENVMKYVDGLTEEAKSIGAVNTLYFEDDKLIGDNTDGRGFILSLMNDSGFDPKEKEVLVLGAGGAAKAIITKLIQESVKVVNIYELNIEKSREVKKQIENINSSTKINLILKDELENCAKKSDLIINCTPVGLKENDPLILSENVFNEKQVVFDLIYNPEKTKLLLAAEKKGAKILNGLGMLVYQGALSFEKWIGEKPNVENMKETIKKSM